MRKILSIDGGGVRGLIAALVLAKLEQLVDAPLSSVFDLIAGTSTGGILALGLAAPDERQSPKYTALQLAALYERRGGEIFYRPPWKKLIPGKTLVAEKYSADGLESVLEEYFGKIELKSALTNTLVTSYDLERRMPFFFRSHAASANEQYNFAMKTVARATSAAPTYFEPLRVPLGGADYSPLVDGGVFANNPGMCALAEAKQLFPREELMLVSIGTGTLKRPIRYDDAKGWGIARWAKPVLDVVMDGVSSTVDYQLRAMLPARRYFRFQTQLDPQVEDMDNASAWNLRRLRLCGEELVRRRKTELEGVASLIRAKRS